jgi:very-short-patch-repair endonuclease
MRHERDVRSPDASIARIAGNQHGVITTGQLRSAGLSRDAIKRRVAACRLHRIHRGVYAVGHPRLGDEGRWMAAVLACGDRAVLSHEDAARLWGFRPRPHRRAFGSVDVMVPTTSGRRRQDGIALHRSGTLTDSDCSQRDGIPVTHPARTLADLRPLLSPAQFARAVREARFLRLAVEDAVTTEGTRSELESRMLALCRRHRLSQPAVNPSIHGYEVDFLWRETRLVVEVDGWDSHRSRSAFEEDRSRDARLALLGYRVVRFTWRQIDHDRAGVARTIRELLRLPEQG